MTRLKKRWLLGILMSSGILINYIDRVNISHALIPLSEDLNLDHVQQGIILSAFSWGYVAFMAIGGILVDKLGAIRVSAWAATAWSLATALSGGAWNYSSMLFSRLAIGAGEAPIFPADARIVREEFPLEERGKATALFDAGSYVGTALSAPIVVFVMVYLGWRASFFACALLGVIWVVMWLHWAPILIKQESQKALQYPTTRRLSSKTLRKLIFNRKVLGASYGFFCYNYAKSFFLTWFPAYLVTERGFSFLSVGIVGMLPPICAVIGEIFAGTLTDNLIKKGTSVTVARKLPLCVGMLLAGTIILTEFVSSQFFIIALLSFSFAATIAASPGIWAIPGDIAPSSAYVGTIGGIQNTFSNCAGIIAPIITGIIVERTGSFQLALTVSAIVTISGALSYWLIVGPLVPLWKEEE